MNLKEQIIADTAVFLNQAEFADAVTIDGVETLGLWDDTAEHLQGRIQDNIYDANTYGVLSVTRTLLVYSAKHSHKHMLGIATPDVGQHVCIDDEHWEVMPGTHESLGVLKLVLRRLYS